jgi:hypothetical protein
VESRLAPVSIERVRRTLSWIAFSQRPLKRIELQAALSVEESGELPKQLLPIGVLDLCDPFVTDLDDDTIQLVHFTVKE